MIFEDKILLGLKFRQMKHTNDKLVIGWIGCHHYKHMHLAERRVPGKTTTHCSAMHPTIYSYVMGYNKGAGTEGLTFPNFLSPLTAMYLDHAMSCRVRQGVRLTSDPSDPNTSQWTQTRVQVITHSMKYILFIKYRIYKIYIYKSYVKWIKYAKCTYDWCRWIYKIHKVYKMYNMYL